MELLLVVCAISACITAINVVTMRTVRVSQANSIHESVAVLIPMRNEINNVSEVLASVQSSRNLTNWEFHVLDDGSSDGTSEALDGQFIDLIAGSPLPDGWLGKNWACHQLAQSTSAEYLVFVDADVRLHPDAISSSIALMQKLDWNFISPYPRQIAISFLERLIQPLLQWSWMSSVPLRLAERFGIPSMTIANGQFLIVKRDAYVSIGGHGAIKSEVLDDLQLVRTLVRAGFSGGVADGSHVASCRMYNSASELVDGYTKSLWKAFGGVSGTIFTVALLISTQVIPIALGYSGYVIGWFAFMLVGLSHAMSALKTKSAPANIFMHPVSILILIALIIESVRRKIRGQLIWRGRTVS
jgi:glycosyltransferase involved in cell wall biosynthesis